MFKESLVIIREKNSDVCNFFAKLKRYILSKYLVSRYEGATVPMFKESLVIIQEKISDVCNFFPKLKCYLQDCKTFVMHQYPVSLQVNRSYHRDNHRHY